MAGAERGESLELRVVGEFRVWAGAGRFEFNKNTVRCRFAQKHADKSAIKNNASLKKRLRRVNVFLDSENIPKKGRNCPKKPTNGLALKSLREVERRFSL